MDKHEVTFTDMSQCQPRSVLSAGRRKKGHWQLVEYEAESFQGTMVACGPETGAPELTLPLNRTGWHRIYLGYRGNLLRNHLKVRLSGDPAFTCLEPDVSDRCLEEGFWKAADLTEQDLILSPRNTGEALSANLAFVRLVPLSEDELAAVEQQQAQPQNRRLIGRCDGGSFYCSKRATTPEEILEEVEPYRNTDFGWLFWERGSDPAWFPTPLGGYTGKGVEDYPSHEYRHWAESLGELACKGINPLRVVLEHAHRLGMKCGFSIRVGMYWCPPFEEVLCGDFFRQHPEFRCRDRDGTEIARLSYAFPEVRERFISFFEEVAEYGADGVGLIFTRGLPVLLYEEPLVEGFKAEFGTDPRQLDEGAPRWLRYRAGVMTDFVRELRQRMDALAERQGREKLTIAANVLVDEEDNLFYALDLETWVREGLVDMLLPFQWWYWDNKMKEIDMDFFIRITKGTSCRLYPDIILQRGIFPPLFREQDVGTPENFLKLAIRLYEKGVDGLSFWDTERYHHLLTPWHVVRHLGHPVKLLRKWLEEGTFQPRTIPLRKIGGFVVDRYPPHWAG